MCVYIKHRAQKPSFPEAKALHRAVWHSRARGASHHYVHTGPDSHTRTHSPDGLTAGGPVPSLLTAPGQEGSRLSGPFQTPSHETETPFPTGKKKKASLNSPADPPPACLELNSRGREVLSNQEVLEAGSSPSDGSAALIFSRRPVCLNPDSDSSLVSSLGP